MSRAVMGNRRFSSSTPRRAPVVDLSWLPLKPGWAVAAQSNGSRSAFCQRRGPFGTWMGRGEAVQRVEGRVLSAPRSPSIRKKGGYQEARQHEYVVQHFL